MSRISLVSLFALAALTAGCASPPKPQSQLAATDCNQLRVEIVRTEEDKRAAVEKKEGAWKVVIPFAIAAQYAVGRSAEDSADKRLEELGRQSTQLGCTS